MTKKNKMEIVRYGLSNDRKGLVAYLDSGDSYHIHSDELSKLEEWIHDLLMLLSEISPNK